MPLEGLLTSELRAAIGVELEPETITVEQRLVERLVKATGDPGPRPGQEVPPVFLLTWMMSGGQRSPRLPPALNWLLSDGELAPVPPFKGVLDGGGEWEFRAPIRMGDAITSTMRIADIKERTGSVGPMLIVTCEKEHRNQWGERVALSRATLIAY